MYNSDCTSRLRAALRLGSIVIKKSSDDIIEKGTRIAEHLLETAAADIEFKNGRFAVKGTNHSVGLFEVARAVRPSKTVRTETVRFRSATFW